MRVLLIWPNSRNEVLGWGDLGALAEPLALEYLAAAAQADGHEARILDLRLHPNELIRSMDEFKPHVVGITAFSMHVLTALNICKLVKSLDTSCLTVIGGHHATLLPEDFFEEQVDFVVAGEGTGPLRQILKKVFAGLPVENEPGVWVRTDVGFVSGGTPSTVDLDVLPPPNRSLTSADREKYFIDWMRPVALLRTSVGCPFRCTYCSLWKIMDGRYLKAQTARVISELKNVTEEYVFLIDDEAFIDGRRMTALAESIQQAGIKKRYFAYCRVDSLLRNRTAIEKWQEIGLERLFIGIDEISDEALDAYRKKATTAKTEEALRLANEMGVEIFAQFVVSPQYSRKDFDRLVRFIEHHQIKYPSFTVLTPIPGTEYLRDFNKITHMQPNGRPNWDLFDCQNAVTATKLSPNEFRKQYRNLYRVFKGSYLRYREHSSLIESHVHDGDVGDLTRKLKEASKNAV